MILSALAVLYSITPVHNGNFFWHLRNGLDIVETGEIRTEDPFTWTRLGTNWIQHEWLAECAMALGWIHGGESGPVLLKAFLIGLSVLLAFKASVKSGGDPVFTFLLGAAWLALAQPRWIARPHIFSIFFFSVYLYVLSFRIREPWKLTLVLFPVQVLWVNVHAGFVMGIFLASVPAMDRFMHREWKNFFSWTLTPLALLAASGIHPNGFRTLEYLPAFLAMPLYKETIREWWSPFDPRYAPLRVISRTAVLLMGLTLSTSALLLFFRKTIDRGRTAALAVLTAATVFAARNGELLAPAMLAWIPGMTRIRLSWKTMIIPALLLLAVPFVYGVPREVGPPRELGAGVDWTVYPVGAADFLEPHPRLLQGSVLFNTNEISGYLEYRFGENLLLFMDGRCLIYPESFYRNYLSLCFATTPDYRSEQYRLLQMYGFNLLVCNIPDDGSVVYLAALLPNWKPLYTDHLTTVYADTRFLEHIDLDELGYRYFDPFDPVEFMSKPLYLLPSSSLEELLIFREKTGSMALDAQIAALEFREGLQMESRSDPPDDPAGYTLECWQNCREGNLHDAECNAALSGDAQLEAAVRILSGGQLGENEYLLGIRSTGMLRNPQAENALAITALWVTGQQEEALERARVQIDSLPGWGIAQCGMLYSLAGQSETALELAERSLEIRQGPVVMERVARIHALEGNYPAAADFCRAALDLSPDFAGARLLLADCLWNMNMVTEALIEYETIVQAGLQLPDYAEQRLELTAVLDN